mmetsp:Transcript_134550/g.348581  ORF Transcript_134550/g.348581 Transcript_134550/m.348581 type:complete len:209 (-) Transcript_134550:1589-2215(-)
MGPTSAHEALPGGCPLHILGRAHLQGCDVALLSAAVAGVQHTALGQCCERTMTELRRHSRAAHPDVGNTLGQPTGLKKDVEHGGHKTRAGGTVPGSEGAQLHRLNDMSTIVGHVQAATPLQQRSEQVVQKGHPSRRMVAQCSRRWRHTLPLSNAYCKCRQVAVRQGDAFGLTRRATREQHDRRIVLVQACPGNWLRVVLSRTEQSLVN